MHKSIFSCADCTMIIMLILEDTVTRFYCLTVSLIIYRVTVSPFRRFTVTPSLTWLSARSRLLARATLQRYHPTPITPPLASPGAFLGQCALPGPMPYGMPRHTALLSPGRRPVKLPSSYPLFHHDAIHRAPLSANKRFSAPSAPTPSLSPPLPHNPPPAASQPRISAFSDPSTKRCTTTPRGAG